MRCLTLAERVALARASTARPSPGIEAALASWVKVYSPGSPAALLRRLAWDGIEPDAAARAIHDSSLTMRDDDFDRALEAFAHASRRSRAPWLADPVHIPFAPVFSPLLDLALARVRAQLPLSGPLSATATHDLVRHLADQLAWWGAPTLLHRFESARANGTGLDEFCRGVLDHPLEFWAEHAALLRRLLTIVRQWADATCELVRRLTDDRDAIREAFGLDAGRVERIRPGLSDRHHDGRQVAILELSDGTKLVYKPRECRSLLRFNELLRWYAARGADDAPLPITVLDRGEYGWVEFVRHDALASRDGVARYYRRAGALLSFAWLLGGRDLHMDNVICSAGGPVLVDTEAFVAPQWSEDGSGHPGAMQLARNRVSSSVIGTGMLSFPQEDARGRVYDIGGLCGEGGYVSPAPARVWKEVGTDAIHVVEEARVAPSMQNVVRLDGRIERPAAFVDEIAAGFGTAVETLVRHRDELLSADGPLARFADARCRIIFRPSNQYAMLLQTMTSPACSRSGLTASFYVESLARVFSGEENVPELWPLVREERHALENLDIPIFTVDCSSKTIDAADGQRIDGLIATTGVDALLDRARRLAPEAATEQTRLIRASLLSSSGHSDDDTTHGEPQFARDRPAAPDHLLAEANRIGEMLLAAAIRGGDGVTTWIAPEYLKITSIADLGATYYLYSGVTGPAIFLAALGRRTGDTRFSQPAREVWTTLERLVQSGDARPFRDHLRLGICNGIGSIVYAAVVASHLLDDASLLDVARGFASLIDEERLSRETDFDVEGGIAGAIVALVRLHEATGEPGWMNLAARGAARLEELARTDGSGSFWVADESAPPLAGMAHGAAGVALALDTLARAANLGHLATLARDAFRWEETVFDPALGNWPVRTSDGRRIDMVAWCHGAAGIGLTRLDQRHGDDLDRAIRAVVASGLHPVDHLCCGNSGRIDVLVEASHRLARPGLLVEARSRAAAMIERAAGAHSYTLTTESTAKDLIRPGFFRGLSGIGYTLLRAADPGSLPAVTRFDHPDPTRTEETRNA